MAFPRQEGVLSAPYSTIGNHIVVYSCAIRGPCCTVRQTTACRDRFSPVLGPEVDLRPLGLVTSVLTPSPQRPSASLGLLSLTLYCRDSLVPAAVTAVPGLREMHTLPECRACLCDLFTSNLFSSIPLSALKTTDRISRAARSSYLGAESSFSCRMYQDKLASLKRQLQQLQEGRCALRAPQRPLLQALEICEPHFCLGVRASVESGLFRMRASVESGLFQSSVQVLLSLIKD